MIVTFDAGETLVELDLEFLARRLAERGVAVDVARLAAAKPAAWRHHDELVAAGARHPWHALVTHLLEGAGLTDVAPLVAWLWDEQPRANLWRKPIPGMVALARELAAGGARVGVLSNSGGEDRRAPRRGRHRRRLRGDRRLRRARRGQAGSRDLRPRARGARRRRRDPRRRLVGGRRRRCDRRRMARGVLRAARGRPSTRWRTPRALARLTARWRTPRALARWRRHRARSGRGEDGDPPVAASAVSATDSGGDTTTSAAATTRT